jgi:hypothetical protein
MSDYNNRLLELWRISRTALSNSFPARFDRLQYVVREYTFENPTAKRKQVYLDIDSLTAGYGNF